MKRTVVAVSAPSMSRWRPESHDALQRQGGYIPASQRVEQHSPGKSRPAHVPDSRFSFTEKRPNSVCQQREPQSWRRSRDAGHLVQCAPTVIVRSL